MKNGTILQPQREKENIDKQQKHAPQEQLQSDTLSLILSKLEVLEEKIDRIEHQTKNHWVVSEDPDSRIIQK